MKIQVRNNVFETNSSSTHAICVAKDRTWKKWPPSEQLFVHGDFGWETAIIDQEDEKASYLYQAICCLYSDEEREGALSSIKKALQHHGISAWFERDIEDGYGGGGYIDHAGNLSGWVKTILNDDKMLMTYLYGDSIVVTGNDNSEWYTAIMYDGVGDKDRYGYYDEYKLRAEFEKYEIYEKGN